MCVLMVDDPILKAEYTNEVNKSKIWDTLKIYNRLVNSIISELCVLMVDDPIQKLSTLMKWINPKFEIH